VAEKYMPQLEPQFVARPGAAVGYDFFFCCLLRAPQPCAIFFIDEFEAHGQSHLGVGALIASLHTSPSGLRLIRRWGWRFSRCVIASMV
jgi:hypothetical protein